MLKGASSPISNFRRVNFATLVRFCVPSANLPELEGAIMAFKRAANTSGAKGGYSLSAGGKQKATAVSVWEEERGDPKPKVQTG
jgi:hypothetical protein